MSDFGRDCVPWWEPTDEYRPYTRWKDCPHLRGASEADGHVAEGQRGGHLQHDCVEGSEWHSHPRPVVGAWLYDDRCLWFNMKPIKLYLEQIFHRYTFGLQEKSIFAIFLEWPVNGSVVLNEPVVTQGQTQVRYEDTNTHTHYFIKYMKCHKFYDYQLCFCLHGVWYLWLIGALKLTSSLLRFVIPIFDAGCRYTTWSLQQSFDEITHCYMLLHQLEENQITPEDEKQCINNVPLEY